MEKNQFQTLQSMTPRQRAIEALERRRPPGAVPTCEIAFDLFEGWLGRPITDLGRLEGSSPGQRDIILRSYVHDTVDVYRQIDHCIITHWYPPDKTDELAELIAAYRVEIGDEFMLGFAADGTRGFPPDGELESFSYRLVDEPEKVKDESKRGIEQALVKAARMKQAGADVVWMGRDYAMNTGPFLSPDMFAEFVTPYLKQVIAGFRELGLYVIKHTDGNINVIIDQIVEAGPHAIHSLDPIANMDIRQVKEEYGDRVALIGNVSHGPLQMKQRKDVAKSARYCLTHGGVEKGGYIYSTSNAVFGGELTGINVEEYRYMLSIRDQFMKQLDISNEESTI